MYSNNNKKKMFKYFLIFNFYFSKVFVTNSIFFYEFFEVSMMCLYFEVNVQSFFRQTDGI